MENNKKYLFVIDIDGTLINTGDSEIKKNIVDEIENLKSKGHIFTISTGRNLNKILNIKYMEIFDYISVLMGSGIYHTTTKSWIKNSEPLNLEETKKINRIFNQKQFILGLQRRLLREDIIRQTSKTK